MVTDSNEEIEVKFRNVDLAIIRKRLKKIGGVLKTPDRVMRRVVFGGEVNPHIRCTYARVRDEGSIVTVSAKYSAVSGEITSQKEVVITVDNFGRAVALLEAVGLIATDYQESKRETWRLVDGTLVELEQWPGLRDYIEIEGASVAALKEAARGLELNWSEHTTDSTDKLYEQQYSLTVDETRKMLRDLRFS